MVDESCFLSCHLWSEISVVNLKFGLLQTSLESAIYLFCLEALLLLVCLTVCLHFVVAYSSPILSLDCLLWPPIDNPKCQLPAKVVKVSNHHIMFSCYLSSFLYFFQIFLNFSNVLNRGVMATSEPHFSRKVYNVDTYNYWQRKRSGYKGTYFPGVLHLE